MKKSDLLKIRKVLVASGEKALAKELIVGVIGKEKSTHQGGGTDPDAPLSKGQLNKIEKNVALLQRQAKAIETNIATLIKVARKSKKRFVVANLEEATSDADTCATKIKNLSGELRGIAFRRRQIIEKPWLD